MIANWMLTATIFAALCAVAALSVDRAMRAFRKQSRMVWAAAICVATTWPVIALLVLRTAPADATVTIGVATSSMNVADAAPSLLSIIAAKWSQVAALLDTPLMVFWIVATALLFFRLLLAIRTIHQVRHRAFVHALDGEEVLVDDAVGPAVIGVLTPKIIVPSWLLSLDSELRSLVLRHEGEHRKARDPLLLWLSVAATTISPWNAPVWWMARRLRLAMEIDCDARTLRHTVDHSKYAKLLLLIAGRNSSTQLALMLSPPSGRSHISRRISAMQNTPLRSRTATVALSIAVAGLAVAAACSNRIATNLASPNVNTGSQKTVAVEQTGKTEASVSEKDTAFFDFQLNKEATMEPGTKGPEFPAAMRAAGISGSVLAQYVVNADGSIDVSTLKIVKATRAEFANAVREALPTIRYSPGEVKGKKVRQLVQAPFAFALNRQPDTARSDQPRIGGNRSNVRAAGATDSTLDHPYFDFQVNKPAQPLPGVKGPAYPPELRSSKVEGRVLVQVVVNADGTPDMSSFKVLKSDHDAFSLAVLRSLTEMRFSPAQVNGKNVKQLVQLPFQFALPDN